MMQTHPFTKRAKPFWYDPEANSILSHAPKRSEQVKYIHFDSLSEYQLYKRIKALPLIQQIAKDLPIVLLPATKTLPALVWRIDFGVWFKHKPGVRFIEFKGGYISRSTFNRESIQLRTQMLLRAIQPDDRFYLVSDCKPFSYCIGRSTLTENQLITQLLTDKDNGNLV